MRRQMLICVLVLLLSPLAAQDRTTAVISGTVEDSRGARIAGVTITAIDEDTGASFMATTDGDGRYRLALAVGRYTIAADLAGFAKQEVRGVAVSAGASLAVNLKVMGGEATASQPPAKPPPTAIAGPPPTPSPTPDPPAPPPMTGSEFPTTPGDGQRPEGALWWNAWPDMYPGPMYKPLKHLKTDTEYLLVLHLSGIEYVAAGLSAQPASGDLRGWAEEWLKTGQSVANLQVLLLPDSNYFKIVDRRVEALPVNLRALRNWVDIAGTQVDKPLDAIRESQDQAIHENRDQVLPSFVFGTLAFRFRTTGREGVGAIALSIWSSAGRPLDEMSLSYCVSDLPTEADPPICRCVRPLQQTLKGVDSVRVAAEGESAPNAALHFLELDQRGVIGVFRENDCGDCTYKVWELGIDGDGFRDYLTNTTLPAFGPTASLDSLAAAGRDLYNLLFPFDDGTRERREARAAFEQFVARDLLLPQRASPVRSIFVRTLLKGTGVAQPVYLPLGLITIPSAPAEFVGFHYRIEVPLDRQSYRAFPSCISRWFFAVPAANPTSSDPLPRARQKFESLMAQWSDRAQSVFPGILELRTWLEQPKPAESAAVVVVSHHDHNTLFFEQNERLTAKQVQRLFGEASVLILNGCSTGAPVALDLIRQFNERGVAATIATHVAIRPEMAGDFVATLGDIVNSGDTQGLTVAEVFFRTVQALRLRRADETALPYGPRALVFSLLGNGAVRICAPRKEIL